MVDVCGLRESTLFISIESGFGLFPCLEFEESGGSLLHGRSLLCQILDLALHGLLIVFQAFDGLSPVLPTPGFVLLVS